LPDPSDIVGEITYTRSGSGAGKRILTVPSGVSVDWGDATVLNGTIELEGTGKVVVRASGGNIKVDEYEDYGSNSFGSWKKKIDGDLEQKGEYTGSTTSTSSKTLPLAMATNDSYCNINYLPGSNFPTTAVWTQATTVISFISTVAGAANIMRWICIGRWR